MDHARLLLVAVEHKTPGGTIVVWRLTPKSAQAVKANELTVSLPVATNPSRKAATSPFDHDTECIVYPINHELFPVLVVRSPPDVP